MVLVLKLHCAPEQVSSLLEYVSKWLHRTGFQKFLATITAQTLATLFKTMDSIVDALSAVELWNFSLEFQYIVDAVCNIRKMMEQYQILSGEFLVNLGQYFFIGRRICLSRRW